MRSGTVSQSTNHEVKQTNHKEAGMEQLLQKFTEEIANQLDNFRKEFKDFEWKQNKTFLNYVKKLEVKCELKDTRERMEEVKERLVQCEERGRMCFMRQITLE